MTAASAHAWVYWFNDLAIILSLGDEVVTRTSASREAQAIPAMLKQAFGGKERLS